MSYSINDNELEQALAEAFTPPPVADFDAWQKQHTDALAYLNPQQNKTIFKNRRLMSRTIIFAAATIVLLCVWLGLSEFGTRGPGTGAFAQVLEQIEKAKTITWKCTQYWYKPKGNGTGAWEKRERLDAYKAPGVYREVRLDEKGQIDYVRITDEINKKELRLYPKSKKAELEEIAIQTHDPHGPFSNAEEELRKGKLQWVEKRKTSTGEVNIFRNSEKWDGWAWDRRFSHDLWIDPATKQLIRHQVPGADIYDPENDPNHNNPIGEKWPNGSPICSIDHDIVFDAKLDDSLFSFTPPEGYTLDVKHRNYVTEQEMIEYLGIMAGVNDGTFPDDAWNGGVGQDRLREMSRKPQADRTSAEQKYMESFERSIKSNLNHGPLIHFIKDKAIDQSFRYLGKGVRLGDKDAVICWYKLKDAKDQKTYRVVYGDLSVKDVAPEDLPLPVEP